MNKVFTFIQSTGAILDETGHQIAIGWAGNGEGRNNPAMQSVHDVGPLPQGVYRVNPWEETHGHLGPMVAPLIQIEGETFGRSAFFIHGPSRGANYGQESKGCIVVPRPLRAKIKAGAPNFLKVVATPPEA